MSKLILVIEDEEDNRRIWTGLYCFRRQGDRCVRKQMYEEGELPADTMLPDGNSLAT